MGGSVLSLVLFLMMPAPEAAQACPALHVRNPAGNYIIPGVKGDISYSGNLALDAYVQRGGAGQLRREGENAQMAMRQRQHTLGFFGVGRA